MGQTLRNLILPCLNAAGPVYLWMGLAMLAPLLVSYLANDGAAHGFILGTLSAFFIGTTLMYTTRQYKRELTAQHGFFLVTLIWASLPLIATIPLAFDRPDYSFAQLYFEAVSCLTTTGATVMNGLNHTAVSINGWRSLLSWMGGMGLIVLAVAILPLLGVGGAQIMKAETSGPLKENKLTPRIADTAKALYIIYLGLSVLCTIAYHLAGMSWRDAIMHMMTTVSLSGISAHDESFAFWDSAAIDWVAIAFMWFSGFNYSLHFIAWKKHNPSIYFGDTEARAWSIVLIVAILVTLWVLISHGTYPDVETALRYVLFTVVSVASSTGYADTDFSVWPLGLPFMILAMACFAACAGSPGGGMKMLRILIMLRHLRRELVSLLFPNAVVSVKINNVNISNKVCFAVFSFILIWILTYLGGAVIFMLSGMPVLESFAGSLSMLSNVGMSLGQLGPNGNYAWLNDFQLMVCCFLMLAGRLEIFTLFVLFTRTFWRA